MYKFVKNFVLTPAISIPVITACAYLLAYMFELGSLSYFGVSHLFIEITINTLVLSALAACLLISYFFGLAFSLFEGYYSNSRLKFRKFLLSYYALTVPFGFLMLGAFVAYYDFKPWWINLSVPFVVVFSICYPFGELIPGLIKTRKNGRPIWIWLEAIYQAKRRSRRQARTRTNHDRSSRELRGLARRAALVGAGIAMIVSAGIIIGRGYAMSRQNFMLFDHGEKRYLLVRDYGDRMIFAGISGRDKLTSEVLVHQLGEDKDISLRPLNISRNQIK